MAYVSKEEINKAASVDLVSLCQKSGINLFEKSGERNQLRWDEHPSLVVNTQKNVFNWFSQQDVAGGPIVFAMKVLNKGTFPEAVNFLNQEDYGQVEIQPEKEREPFKYSYKNQASWNDSKSYLLKRGIDEEILDCLHDKGMLQQAKRYYPKDKDYKNSLVFVWAMNGKPVGATTQKLEYDTEKYGERGREKQRITSNSEKNYGFNITLGQPEDIYVFESAVDLLSYWTLNKGLTDCMLVEIEGVKAPSVFKFLNQMYLSKGTIPKNIYMGVDNDPAGQILMDNFRGLEYQGPDGELVSFKNNIPTDNQILSDHVTLYKQAVSELDSSVDWKLVAAIHKAIGNGGDTNKIANGYNVSTYFVAKPDTKKEPINVLEESKKLVKDLEPFVNQPLDKIQALFNNDSISMSSQHQIFKKISEYYTKYSDKKMVEVPYIHKDWNDQLVELKGSKEYINQLQRSIQDREFTGESGEKLVVHKNKDTQQYEAKINLDNGSIIPFFEAESAEEMVSLIKNYGFKAVDKEDRKRYSKELSGKQQKAVKSAELTR